MGLIVLDTWNRCTSQDCLFNRECAQHETAGDFRTEDGFRPELNFINNQWNCKTKDEPKDEIVTYANFPQNIDDLGMGFISRKEMEEMTIDNYQI